MNNSVAHTQLVKACLEELALMGYAAWPNNTGALKVDDRFVRYGKRGSGDIFVLLPRLVDGKIYGVHGEIECKTGGAVQMKHQKTHMRVVRNNGGVYLVVRSREEIAAQLATLGFRPTNPAYASSTDAALLL